MNIETPVSTFFLVLFGAVFIVFLGNLIGRLIPPLNRFALPGAVLGGLLALLLSPQITGTGWIPVIPSTYIERLYLALRDFPGLFINIVFACLMLGRRFEPFGRIWHRAKPQIVMGHLFAWGQHLVGLLLAVTLLVPLLGLPELVGPLIAIGFQGGHGTAAGLAENFTALGFEDGEDFGLTVATFGIFAGVVAGPFLANFLASRHGEIAARSSDETGQTTESSADAPQDLEPNPLTGRLTMHLATVGIVVGVAWLLLQFLQSAEQFVRDAASDELFSNYLPLFSIVLLTGMAFQTLLQKLGWDVLFDRGLYEKIGSFSLDMVIVGALATLSLTVLSEHWLAITMLCLSGIGWNLVIFFLVGPRVYRSPWFAYGLGDLGGGTATTASGIMLIRVADPEARTDALRAYADKQPFYEPIMGGGLVTALALPAVAFLGAWVCLAIVAAIFAGWSLYALRLARST